MNSEKCPVYSELCDPQTRETCWLYKQYQQQQSYTVGNEDPRIQFPTEAAKQQRLEGVVIFARENDCPQVDNFVNDDDPPLLEQIINQ